ncbi:MAG: SGNH/GDSL hydrolase family protein [Proteiniphilum sp.]|uniref:SGNH/GDSL hydrolase family protein n=1 Tax=Proteiniphilum sp. TaxID=1926877 RepID=UPI002B1FA211|nr:SGNH/GDSL hydrolase family protein [Proteiniphilum sp.]MEA5128058.1 SGNH/GDSL hydrolase family protein [Proteiniphilum sp.]
MRKYFLPLLLFIFSPLILFGQITYHDASQFPLLGKATTHTATRYERLPDSLEQISRKPVWELGKCSAGLAIRFRSNSTTIAAKWEVLYDRNMNHMTPTGIKGLDLYALVDDTWRFVNSGRPQGKTNEAIIITNMEAMEREYMLYLPLYDGITGISIGIDSNASVSLPAVDLPIRKKPVVCYGTSILQGGCASRPGMAHSNILSRWLNREFINLGFSGNALLDYEIAEVIAEVDASLYIFDFVPNATVQQMQEKAAHFFDIIRTRRPDTPILFVEDPIFTHTFFDQRVYKEVNSKNKTIHEIFQTLKAHGEKNIYFLSSKDMLGDDGEATVDGIHFTDVGFMRYSELLYPVIQKLLNQ